MNMPQIYPQGNKLPAALPEDIKQISLWLVKGYDRMRKNYLGRREAVLYAHHPADSTLHPSPHQQLEELESLSETRRLRAVETALEHIGLDVSSLPLRERLRQAILLNCNCGRKYPFEVLGLEGFSRMDFYRRKRRFLAEVAQLADLVSS